MSNHGYITFIALVGSCFHTNAQDGPTVTTVSGPIRGHYLVSASGKKYKSFEGIPFAEKPVTDLRFQPPVPVKPWTAELLANKFKGACMGVVRAPTTGQISVNGAEDCLYLNIYVPDGKYDNPLPVIIWIHGGAYQTATLAGSEQKYLVDQDVIFVTLNYRVSALGFLSTDDAVVPGNMGLKDQALAMMWICDNLKNFGGDPKLITLIGVDAGAASVHYSYLSPLTAGMFRSGISISGTAMSYWALKRSPRENAVRLGGALKCPTNDMAQMVACLRKSPAQQLLTAAGGLYPWILSSSVPFGPVIEKSGAKPFLNRDPMDIINSGNFPGLNIPWITGLVSDEGLLSVAGFITNSSSLQELSGSWASFGPDLMYYDFEPQRAEVSKAMLAKYLDGKPISSSNLRPFVNMLNDGVHNVHAERAVRAMAKVNPTWLYYYSYKASSGLARSIISKASPKNFTLDYGPSHTDDALLLFENYGPDSKMHDELVRFWSTVTKTGSPKTFVAAWPNVNANKPDLDYLDMAGPGNLTPKTFKNFGDTAFWKSIKFI